MTEFAHEIAVAETCCIWLMVMAVIVAILVIVANKSSKSNH